MLCWLFGHNYQANPHDRDYNDSHCAATCSKCGHAKWIDFGEYSAFYANLTSISDNGVYSRDIIKTLADPWGKEIMKNNLAHMKPGKKQLPYVLVGHVMDAEKALYDILIKELTSPEAMQRSSEGLAKAQQKAALEWLSYELDKMGLEIRAAARANDLYKYRLAPKGEKLILAHFNSIDEITKYLKELSTATQGDNTMT